MILKSILLLALGLVVAASVYVRLAPLDPALWHQAPDSASRTGKPNDYFVGDGGDRPVISSERSPEALAEEISADLLAQPGVSVLATTPELGLTTYVQRTRLMGYPDLINVQVQPDQDGSRLTIWSRSRFGQSDLGVNKARVDALLDRLGLLR